MPTKNGFIALPRNFTGWRYYYDPVIKSVFLHILLCTNWQESFFEGKKLQAGQTVITHRRLTEELQDEYGLSGISVRQVRTALEKLSEGDEPDITLDTHSCRCSIVTVINWKEFQPKSSSAENKKKTNRDKAEEERTAIDRHVFS